MLSTNKRLKFVPPDGAFYVFLDVSNYIGHEFKDPATLCEVLLEKVRVALVPGEAFGSKKHVRISYATSTAELARGIERLLDFFK
jgi:aspartate/methionine/tyrosine aminotransferase